MKVEILLKAKCIENNSGNINFIKGNLYELSTIGIRTEIGGMWSHFSDWNMPKSFKNGSIFEFGVCKFKIIDNKI